MTIRRALPGALIALAAALLGACRSAPEPLEPDIADQTTFLGLAVAEASRLEDSLDQADLYTRIARGYRELGDEASVSTLAQTALQLARAEGATEESIRTRLDLAPMLAATGNDDAALAALETGLAFAATAPDPRTRASLLPAVVASALGSDEPARPLLRRAVDEVYVIEDARQRAEALIEVANLYQAGDTTLPVTGLIQQAIPAVRSVGAPGQRAVLFARLAVLASRTNERRLAERLADNAISEIESFEVTDQELLQTVSSLGQVGRLEEAVGLLRLFGEPVYRALAYAALAPSTPTFAIRIDYLRQAGAAAGLIDDPGDQVEAHVAIGFEYAAAATPRAALPHASAALTAIVDNPQLYGEIEPAAGLVALYVRIDSIQSARNLLLQAPDEYVRGTVAVRAARQLIDDGRLGVADDFLTIALVASDEATYLADGLRQEIVEAFARTGSIRLAIRTVERMEDELLRARSVASLAIIAEPAGLVTPIYRADLASVLASR